MSEAVVYEGDGTGVTFSEWVRSEAGPLWDQMVHHRFTQDVARDTLDDEAWRRYLVYEHAFVETAVTIFGYALVRAPSIAEQARLAHVLSGLTSEQLVYFDRVFESIGMSTEERRSMEHPDEVGAFRDGMLAAAAHGTYEEIIGSMCAAEWMYLTWCTEAQQHANTDANVREWVAMHVDPQFAGQVAWLRGQLDEYGPTLGPRRQRAVAAAFSHALALEIRFHDAPYQSAPGARENNQGET